MKESLKKQTKSKENERSKQMKNKEPNKRKKENSF